MWSVKPAGLGKVRDVVGLTSWLGKSTRCGELKQLAWGKAQDVVG